MGLGQVDKVPRLLKGYVHQLPFIYEGGTGTLLIVVELSINKFKFKKKHLIHCELKHVMVQPLWRRSWQFLKILNVFNHMGITT